MATNDLLMKRVPLIFVGIALLARFTNP